MSNKLYDILNKLQRWMMAFATLYVTLAGIWGLPFGDQVHDTFGALTVFLAAILEVSTVVYKSKQATENKSLDWEGIENELDHLDDWEGEG